MKHKFGSIAFDVLVARSLYDSLDDSGLDPLCEKVQDLQDALESFAIAWAKQNAPEFTVEVKD